LGPGKPTKYRSRQFRPAGNAKRGAWRPPVCFFRGRRDAEGITGSAHRKSGVKTAVILNDSARWSHTDSSVHCVYNSLLLPRIGECNWKIGRAQRAKSSHSISGGKYEK
jgi:hypothetical protein